MANYGFCGCGEFSIFEEVNNKPHGFNKIIFPIPALIIVAGHNGAGKVFFPKN